MNISEIFYSLQGEGTWTGLPNIFIRATGCNLRCSYCDTKFAYKNGTKITIEQIVNQVEKYPCQYVCITGGEPLIQQETLTLIDVLSKKNYKICLETNGSRSIVKLMDRKSLMISLDIKCPSSKMHDQMDLKNITHLREKDQLKFIISNKKDYNYAKTIIHKYEPVCPIFFQPVWGTDPKLLATWILKDGLDVKLGVQLQKILWGEQRGL